MKSSSSAVVIVPLLILLDLPGVSAQCSLASLGATATMSTAACTFPTANLGTCSVACATGYAGAAMLRTCVAVDTWNSANPVCVAVCDSASLALTTAMDVSLCTLPTTATTTTCNVACATGYTGTAMLRTCNGVNTWDATNPVCIGTCTAASLGITTGVMSVAGCTLPTTSTVTTCTVACGTNFVGTAVPRTCTGINVWSLANPVCAASPVAASGCSIFNLMGYFNSTMTTTCLTVNLPGTTCTVSCSGTATTSSTVTCNGNYPLGYWTGTAPNCGNNYASGACGNCDLSLCQGSAKPVTGWGGGFIATCECLPCNAGTAVGKSQQHANSRELSQFTGLQLMPMITVTCTSASTDCCYAAFAAMACTGVYPLACQCGTFGTITCPGCPSKDSNKGLFGLLALLGLIPLCCCCLLLLAWLCHPSSKKARPINFANFNPGGPPVAVPMGSFMSSVGPEMPSFIPPVPPPPMSPAGFPFGG